MDKYGISRSTALRDIQSLEEIGMPIFSKSGRNGRYGILPNRLLSPIVFTIDEVYALYFAMQTLHAYQSTPFHLSIEQLKQKFERCISEERVEKLRRMELIFSLTSYQNKNECSCLDEILRMAVDENACEILYQKGESRKHYCVQFFNITSAYGQWYATAYNFRTEKPQVFRCDKIYSLQVSDEYAAKPASQFLISSDKLFQDEGAIRFEVGISMKGVDLFYKEHYPSMKLTKEDGGYYVRGFYNQGEERFIANYFLAYDETILSVQPDCLKTLILKRIEQIKAHLKTF